ncbi:MAG: C1 family peptidase, partial [Chthoniobacterales bacterium]
MTMVYRNRRPMHGGAATTLSADVGLTPQSQAQETPDMSPYRRQYFAMVLSLILSEAVPFRVASAQEDCPYQQPSFNRTKDLARAEILTELRQTMKPEFTFQITDNLVVGQSLFGAIPPDPDHLEKEARQQRALLPETTPPVVGAAPLPASFDWAAQGKVTTVKCQGCQDCWAFACAAVMESSLLINGRPQDTNLSEQCIVDCSKGGTCRRGGWWPMVFHYATVTGIPDEQSYPYAHHDAGCRKT